MNTILTKAHVKVIRSKPVLRERWWLVLRLYTRLSSIPIEPLSFAKQRTFTADIRHNIQKSRNGKLLKTKDILHNSSNCEKSSCVNIQVQKGLDILWKICHRVLIRQEFCCRQRWIKLKLSSYNSQLSIEDRWVFAAEVVQMLER